MRLRIRTVLRYPWPDSWGAFSGCSGFCCRASAFAVFFLVSCFQRPENAQNPGESAFCPDVSARRTSTYGTKTLNFVALLTLDQISALPQIARSAPSPRVCLLRAQIATTQQKIEMRCISESQPPPPPPPPLPSLSSLSSLFVRARAFARTCICTPKPSCK